MTDKTVISEAVEPSGLMTQHRRVFVSLAGYHSGGLGQHLSFLVEHARARDLLAGYISPKLAAGDEPIGTRLVEPWGRRLGHWTPLRFMPGARAHLENDLYDRKAASKLCAPVECLVGMNGQALHCFRRARELSCEQLELIAATSHVQNVRRQHDLAHRQYPIEPDWLSEGQRRKSLEEYAMADALYVGSEYSRLSFVREGVPPEKLRRVRYAPDARFTPPESRPGDGVFRIVYCGAITVTKGVPVLVEAFARLRSVKAELLLVGGCATRKMRRWLDAAIRRDERIKWTWGDPLPHYHRADVCCHPSYQDGAPYSTVEALACGLPLIVTEDTGTRELVKEGVNGYVVPTGDVSALLDRLEQLARNPLPRV